ncbi:MAG: DMT family transporter, partial [Veillonella sp.]|nr:DMT family transporter [Veillonella sp.]
MAKKGLIYALLSALLLSTMNLFVKMLGSNIPSGEIAFFRGLFGTVAVLIVMYIKGIRFSTEDRGLLVMRGLYGGFGMVCNFIALVHMKMSDATILFQTSGIFVFIFSAFFLKERVPKGAGKWLILIFIAVMVMVNPFSYGGFTWYALVAVLGAALSAAAYTTIRSISKHGKHSNFEIMAYFLITGMIAGLVTTDGFVMPEGQEWLIITAIG